MKRSLLDDRRVVLGGTALVAALMVALTWFVGVNKQLSAAEDYEAQRDDTELQYATIQTKLAELTEQSDRKAELEDALVSAQGGLPSTTALPAFTRQLAVAAADAEISLDNVSIDSPTGAVDPATPAPVEGDAAAPEGPQAIAVSLTSTGTLRQQVAFVQALQDGARRALVGSTQMSVGDSSKLASVDGKTAMTTQVTIFTAP